MNTLSPSLPETPVSDLGIEREPLPSACAVESAPNTQHPFVAFKETHRASGAWRIRVQSRASSSAVLYPNALRLLARATSEKGRTSFTWSHTAGANFGDPLKFRVHVTDGEPAAIELLTSKKAASGATPDALKFCWPVA